MNIIVMGAGYVGLVTGACFAELGNHVVIIDVNHDKIAQLRQGILPIYEPGLSTLVISNREAGRLFFETSLNEIVLEADVIVIAVGTPSDESGAANIQYVLQAANNIGAYIKRDCVIVDKSTVPVGMADKVHAIIQAELYRRHIHLQFDVVSNPEFLREGAAIEDFMRPDRIIVGVSSERAKQVMLNLYLPIIRQPERIYFMQVKDAEMTKYAANAMLATRISFMNEMALLCDRMGVDIENVRLGIGSDSRIGHAFLYPGCGYGGSCFPKDVSALIHMAEQYQVEPFILRATEERNQAQKKLLVEKIINYFGENLSQLIIGVWGLSFKPETDDMREAPSIILLEELIKRGARIQAYDPAAMNMARGILPSAWFTSSKLILVEQQYQALEQANALVLVTEWKPFCYPDITMMKNLMRQQVIFDGRNQYDLRQLEVAGFHYFGIGRGHAEMLRDDKFTVEPSS